MERNNRPRNKGQQNPSMRKQPGSQWTTEYSANFINPRRYKTLAIAAPNEDPYNPLAGTKYMPMTTLRKQYICCKQMEDSPKAATPFLLPGDPEPSLPPSAPEPSLPPSAPEPSLPPSAPEPSLPPSAQEPSLQPKAPEPSLQPKAPEPSLPPSAPEPSLPPSAPEPSLPPSAPEPSLQPKAPERSLQPKAPLSSWWPIVPDSLVQSHYITTYKSDFVAHSPQPRESPLKGPPVFRLI